MLTNIIHLLMKDVCEHFKKAIQDPVFRSHGNHVFDDFLVMAICAFAMGRMEDRYQDIIKRYSKPEINQFPAVLAAMVNDYTKAAMDDGSWDDVLGVYFEQNNSLSVAQRSGQFFTPVTVCDMMARMVEGPGVLSGLVCDPTCGSGRNLIAHARLAPKNRFDYTYYGMDLDRRCVNMTLINMVMYGMKGYVIHMNTLSMEVFAGYRVYLPETGLGIMPLSVDYCLDLVRTKSTPADTSVVDHVKSHGEPTQLNLF